LFQRVRLVEQDAYGHRGRPGGVRRHAGKELDTTGVQPGTVDHGATEAEHDRGPFRLGCLDDSLQRVRVPGFKVTNCVTARLGGGQELGQGHYRHELYLSMVLRSTVL